MTKEPKELYNGFLFLRMGDKVDSPLVAYTLNLESVNIDCLEEEFEEKIEALKNGKNVTIKLVCNKAEVVSPERIVEYACGEQRQPDTTTHDSIPAETGKNDGDKTSDDCISRQQAIDFVGSMNMCDEISNEACKKLTSYLDELPSAQPDIIRCKDCKFYTAYDYTGKLMCKRIGKGMILPKPEDYCSYAERITDGRPN